MSLKSFHIFFVTISVALAFAFGFWNFRIQPATTLHMVAGFLACLSGIGLIVYGIKFYQKVSKLVAVAVVTKVFFAAPNAMACAVCFGASDALETQGMKKAVWVLLGIVVFMWISFGAFFLRLRRFSKGESVS